MHNNGLRCTICNGNQLMVKYEAKYVYSYTIDEDSPGLKNTEEFLPFLYDDRKQTEAIQYIECNTCNMKYPVISTHGSRGIDFKDLLVAIGGSKETES